MTTKKSVAELAYEKLYKDQLPKIEKKEIHKTDYSNVIGACHLRAYNPYDEATKFMARKFSRKHCSMACAMIISNDTGYVCAMRHGEECNYKANYDMDWKI